MLTHIPPFSNQNFSNLCAHAHTFYKKLPKNEKKNDASNVDSISAAKRIILMYIHEVAELTFRKSSALGRRTSSTSINRSRGNLYTRFPMSAASCFPCMCVVSNFRNMARRGKGGRGGEGGGGGGILMVLDVVVMRSLTLHLYKVWMEHAGFSPD